VTAHLLHNAFNFSFFVAAFRLGGCCPNHPLVQRVGVQGSDYGLPQRLPPLFCRNDQEQPPAVERLHHAFVVDHVLDAFQRLLVTLALFNVLSPSGEATEQVFVQHTG
jgi:hypothetical protein